jgi:hypothetical protein
LAQQAMKRTLFQSRSDQLYTSNKEKSQLPIEVRRRDPLLQSLEDVNLETDIDNTQGRIQTLSTEPAYPLMSTIADEIPELKNAYELVKESSLNPILQHPRPATEVQPPKSAPTPPVIESRPLKLRVSTRWRNAVLFPPPRFEDKQAREVVEYMRQRCYGVNMRFRKRRKKRKPVSS